MLEPINKYWAFHSYVTMIQEILCFGLVLNFLINIKLSTCASTDKSILYLDVYASNNDAKNVKLYTSNW